MGDTQVAVLVLVLGIGATIFGIYLLVSGIRVWTRVKESKQWPKVRGVILEARIGHSVNKSTGIDSSTSVDFHLFKKYEYSVSGRTYISEQRLASENIHLIFFTPMNKTEKAVKKLLRYSKLKYPDKRTELLALLKKMKGKSVEVFYNPRNNSDACLTTKMPGNVYLQLFMSIFTLSAGCFLLYLLSMSFLS